MGSYNRERGSRLHPQVQIVPLPKADQQLYSFRELVMKKLCLLAAFAALVVGAQAGDGTQQAPQPGIDTLAPVVTATALPCGCREFTATELRNIPDPPSTPPKERDQVESGIQRIRLALDPKAINVALSDLTPASFPQDNPVKSATFKVCLTDKSKPGEFVIEVLDWKGNVAKQLVKIAAATPAISVTSFDFGLVKVGQTANGEVTVTNNGDGPMILEEITLQNGSRVSLTAGGSTPSEVPANGGTHKITFTYTPTLASENGDEDVLTVKTPCGDVTVTIKGKGGVSRIATDDWDAGSTFDKCLEPGLVVRNTGNVDMTVTALSISGAPEFTVSNPLDPTLPRTIPAGGSETFKKVCFKTDKPGNYEATIEIVSDATDGADNKVKLTATNTVSVEDEIGKTALAWFDANSSMVVVETVRPESVVTIHDLQGRMLASAVANGQTMRFNASAWSGVVVVNFTSTEGVVTRSLSLTR